MNNSKNFKKRKKKKKEKRKQNITRHIEVKKKLTIARGECGGTVGIGVKGTIIKDTWTKSKGRVALGEGGGFSWSRVEVYKCN